MEENKNSENLLKEIERLHEDFKRLRENIDQSYYSIPKKEFENITVKKITQEVSEEMNKRFNTWKNIFLILLSILSIFRDFPVKRS